MPAGRKKTISAPVIKAPTPLTQYNFTSPTGDSYATVRDGNSQYTQNLLTPQTAATIQASQNGLQGLAQDLAQPSDQMYQNIAQQSQNFYDLQAQNINNESNTMYDQTASDLSHRFGGTYNSTFGALALDQLQKNRLNALYNASKEATMYGQDLYNQDQSNQINRFQVLNNYLNNLYGQAQSSNELGSNLLENEANRAQNLGISQANLAQRANELNQQVAQAAAKRRMALLNGAVAAAGYIAAPVTGGASIPISQAFVRANSAAYR